MTLFERKSPIFMSIIKEDDADDILNGGLEAGSADYNGGTNDAGGNNANDQAADTDANTGNPDNANDETKVDSRDAEEDEDKAGNDLDIDTSLNGIDDEENNDNGDNTTDSNQGTSSTSTVGTDNSTAEPVKNNTNIFSSLTAEEQAIKIREQKQQFYTLFVSCNDMLQKISNINTENINIKIITKITKALSSLREYLNDYVTYQFDHKSFIDNDIILDRFLLTFSTISSILDSIKLPDDDQNGSKKS